jgi:GNAT superfamily N-acetyltransferase
VSDDALAARLAGLSPESRALLQRRLASRRAGGRQLIPRRDPYEPVPISFAQWRLWFLEQLRPGTNAWNTPLALRLHGPLDLDALRRSLQALVERHATLRTVFSAPGGRPVPLLLEDPYVELEVLDGEALTGAPLELRLRAFLEDEVRRPFDLESDLMLRARLMRIEPEQHVLVLIAHHIACDGWSKGLLLDELGIAYDALSAGERPQLPELPIEYADFAVWQRRSLSGERLERLRSYWVARLAGAAPALELPTDYPRPRTQTFRGAVEWLAVPAHLAESVVALGRREQATPFMTLMAAFKALLYAHSGQEDVLVGSPAAMRTHPELERLIGLFANTLVYRTSLAGGPSFRELLRRVRETAIGVYEHQDLPFEKIVEAVKPPRDPSRNPLVQVNIRAEGQEPELRLRGVRCEAIPLDPGIARFDLAIELGASNDAFAGYLEYDTGLFGQSTAATLAGDFLRIVDAAVSSPDASLDELEPVRGIRRGESHRRQGMPVMELDIVEPKGEEEFEAYYRIRYERLRKPLGLPPGTERDDTMEPATIHRVVKIGGRVVAAACWVVGMRRERNVRRPYVRFRQMAVDPEFEGRGIGNAIMRHVEENARAIGAIELVGNVRMENVPWLSRHGWIEVGEGVKLYDQVASLAMSKPLT